jgi:hypothetical protein
MLIIRKKNNPLFFHGPRAFLLPFKQHVHVRSPKFCWRTALPPQIQIVDAAVVVFINFLAATVMEMDQTTRIKEVYFGSKQPSFSVYETYILL